MDYSDGRGPKGGAMLSRYNLYNKPWVVSQWFKEARPKQDFFLVLDADMVIRRPFLPEEHGVRQGADASPHVAAGFLCLCGGIWGW